jgi:midasin
VIVQHYLAEIPDAHRMSTQIVDFYLDARRRCVSELRDGSNQRPHYSLRTLCRALLQARNIHSVYGTQRSLYEGFCMSFLTQLNASSHGTVYGLLRKLFGIGNSVSLPAQPEGAFVHVCGFWLKCGPLEPITPRDYILTTSINENLLNVARVVVSRRYPVLLQGPTSAGKTSLIEYLVGLLSSFLSCPFCMFILISLSYHGWFCTETTG